MLPGERGVSRFLDPSPRAEAPHVPVDPGPDLLLAYDLWWHIAQDVAVSSEWGTPSMVEDGIVGELLLGRKYGHKLHFWDLRRRRHVQEATSATSI